MLRRWAVYLQKVFDFRVRVAQLRDSRLKPRIPTANVWLSALAMFALRLRSLHRLEQELRRAKRWESWVGAEKPSADTTGRVMARLEGLRELVVVLNRIAWRNKAIHLRPLESYRVVAVDGHELWRSRARCCSECLVRRIKVGDQTVLEYYHRVVMAQWVGVSPPAILDLELIKPHEGEVVAARRLLKRLFSSYGRLIDVISADALYLEAPFTRDVIEAGKHVVVVLKQEARDLYQDALRLRALVEPKLIQDGSRTTRLWDLVELDSFSSLGRPVRVVWAEEQTVTRCLVGGKLQQKRQEATWIWVTDLSAGVVPAHKIQRWGHDRWDLENRGFNELVNLWHMNHCFIHNAHAVEALLLTLAVAFLTTYLFYERNLKPAARLHLTRLALATRLLEDFSVLGGLSVWSAFRPPG